MSAENKPAQDKTEAQKAAEQQAALEIPTYAGEYGQLTPCGGGDPIPLVKKRILVGRKGDADIQLRFHNVSTQHCRLTLEYGYWFVRDLNSRNGTKVDNRSVVRKRIDPGGKLSIARHDYIVEFDPKSLGAYGPPPSDDDFMDELMRSSLMDRAGLSKRDKQKQEPTRKSADESFKKARDEDDE